MRRMVIFAATVACALGLSACDLIEYVTEYQNQYYNVVEATESKIWNYNSQNPIYEVSSDVLSVTVHNIPSGKTLYLVKYNTGSQNISLNDTRTIVSSSRSALNDTAFEAVNAEIDTTNIRKHFVGEKLPNIKHFSSARSVLPSYTVTQIEPDADNLSKTTKKIYVDTEYNQYQGTLTSYKQKSATLRAMGTYCYVWVVDDYYRSTSSGNKVNTTIAQEYATKFDEMYPMITNVFGDESNEIIDYDSKQMVDINTVSDTGEKINIVIYDIGNDYNASNKSGIVGYFYAKDYHYSNSPYIRADIIGKSNIGKYFYIDSGYANSNFNDTISTLAHEFQHMVNFNQKDIEHSISPSTAYNEMLSMLCEDMMQEHLNLNDYASPKNRIQQFNEYYYLSGITEYRNDSYAVLSYATSYAFGAWLCRQYGGAALVKAMMENNSVDNESIVAAVNSVNGTSHSFETLFKQFLLALTKNTTYTHNQDAATTLTYSTTYNYPMPKFDLWSTYSTQYDSTGDGKKDATYTFSLKNTEFAQENKKYAYTNYDWNGPFLFSASHGPTSLRSGNGISIHGVETTSAGSKTYTFTSTGADTLKMYLIIQ